MFQLDRLDRRVLYELDCNARISVSDLSRKIRQGRDRVEYRLKRLTEKRVLRKSTASINLACLGFTIYKLYFRLESDRPAVAEFIKFLRAHPRVYWTATSDGSWDLMIAVFAKTSVEFFEIQREIRSEYNAIILNSAMYQLVEMDMYSKGYFVKKAAAVAQVGGAPEVASIDKTDYAILRALSSNARRSTSEIAERISSTAAIVKYRIERMEQLSIITGYRIEIGFSQLQMQLFKSQLYLKNFDKTLQAELREYCRKHPHITYFIQQLGDCSIEIEMEVFDYPHYSSIIDDLRSRFPGLVRNFQTVLIRKTYFNWVPGDILF